MESPSWFFTERGAASVTPVVVQSQMEAGTVLRPRTTAPAADTREPSKQSHHPPTHDHSSDHQEDHVVEIRRVRLNGCGRSSTIDCDDCLVLATCRRPFSLLLDDMLLRQGKLWLRPVLGHDWGRSDKHRKVDWSELFSDLVIVALALQMSAAVKRDLTWATLATLSTMFLLFQSSWLALANFVSRFPTNDLVYKVDCVCVHSSAHVHVVRSCVRVLVLVVVWLSDLERDLHLRHACHGAVHGQRVGAQLSAHRVRAWSDHHDGRGDGRQRSERHLPASCASVRAAP